MKRPWTEQNGDRNCSYIVSEGNNINPPIYITTNVTFPQVSFQHHQESCIIYGSYPLKRYEL